MRIAMLEIDCPMCGEAAIRFSGRWRSGGLAGRGGERRPDHRVARRADRRAALARVGRPVVGCRRSAGGRAGGLRRSGAERGAGRPRPGSPARSRAIARADLDARGSFDEIRVGACTIAGESAEVALAVGATATGLAYAIERIESEPAIARRPTLRQLRA